jgi:hypothetical protein
MPFLKFMAPMLVLLLSGQSGSQAGQHYVVLSPAEAKIAAKDFPRWPRETVNGTWTLSQSDVDGLESNIGHIADIPFPNSAYKDPQIPHPEKYYRQYAGIILDRRRIIYVNALCESAGKDGESYWREKFVLVFDGGACFWNVRYDPQTKRFSELMVNGVA